LRRDGCVNFALAQLSSFSVRAGVSGVISGIQDFSEQSFFDDEVQGSPNLGAPKAIAKWAPPCE
jgi:hypothetical protein